MSDYTSDALDAKADQDSRERDWKRDFGQENGNYQNRCVGCGHQFFGHKHRRQCKKCFYQVKDSGDDDE